MNLEIRQGIKSRVKLLQAFNMASNAWGIKCNQWGNKWDKDRLKSWPSKLVNVKRLERRWEPEKQTESCNPWGRKTVWTLGSQAKKTFQGGGPAHSTQSNAVEKLSFHWAESWIWQGHCWTYNCFHRERWLHNLLGEERQTDKNKNNLLWVFL